MDHRDQQQEYRRLKRERAERLAREEAVRSSRSAGLKLQARLVFSHDEMLELLRLSPHELPAFLGDRFAMNVVEIICIEPSEGGWTFVVPKQGD